MKNRDKKIISVYNYIESYIGENGYAPSMREISSFCGIKSTASVNEYIDKLVEDGLLVKTDKKKRTINTVKKCGFIPSPVVGRITAGEPILAVENLEGYYPIPTDFGENTYILNVSGRSMIGVGIFNGDKIIVRKQDSADNGDIVVAMHDDCATVKTFFKRDGKFILHPENPALEDIVLNEVQILGKVIGLIRKY